MRRMSRRDTWTFLAQAGLESTRVPRLILLSGLLVLLLFVAYTSSAQTTPALVPAGTSLSTPGTEWLFQAALTADMLQSLQIHRTHLAETNTLLGAHAAESHVVAYFVGMGVAHYLLTRALVREHVSRSVIQAWESGTIGIEVAYVKHNASLGVHFYVP